MKPVCARSLQSRSYRKPSNCYSFQGVNGFPFFRLQNLGVVSVNRAYVLELFDAILGKSMGILRLNEALLHLTFCRQLVTLALLIMIQAYCAYRDEP